MEPTTDQVLPNASNPADSFLDPQAFYGTVVAILARIKNSPHAVHVSEVFNMDLKYTKTAWFYLKQNKYVKESSRSKWESMYFINPAKLDLVVSVLTPQA